MELLSIESEEEQIAITNATSKALSNVFNYSAVIVLCILVGINSQYWTSLNDFNREDFWIWESTGTSSELFVNWADGHPNRANSNYRCVYIGYTGWKWFSEDCFDSTKKHGYICEKPRNSCST